MKRLEVYERDRDEKANMHVRYLSPFVVLLAMVLLTRSLDAVHNLALASVLFAAAALVMACKKRL